MPSDPAGAVAPRPSRRVLTLAALAAGAVALIVVAAGIAARGRQAHRALAFSRAEAIPVVALVSPTPDSGAGGLALPGTLEAYYNAPIYARTPGYLKAWYHDIGAAVRRGEALAVIDTPDLDQQIIQARADLATAQATMALAGITARRWAGLLKEDAVSAQETDEKQGDLVAKTAEVGAARANLGRLEALKGFARIVAPFAGVVTARKTDIGFLVGAGAGAAPSAELFDVAEVDRLRLYVSVPQVDSALVAPGVAATLTVPQYPGRTFPATLVAKAGAVSHANGAEQVELLVDNAAGLLAPGDYAEVAFRFPERPAAGGVRLPSSALLFRDRGPEVAVVGPADRVALRPVSVTRDLGTTLEIGAGVAPGDKVIDNPPDSIADGELVRIAAGAPVPGPDRRRRAGFATLLLAVLAGGCQLAPPYAPPKPAVPQAWRDLGPWAPAAPNDAASRGDWWAAFGDPVLGDLESRAAKANPTLAAAAAAYDEARAYAAEGQSQLYPQIGASGLSTYNRQSVNRPERGAGQPNTFGDDTLGAEGYYEFDFWGRVRDLAAAGRAEAQASAADLATARLGLQAEVAGDYLALRGLDREAALLQETVAAYDRAFELTRRRHAGGAVSGLDVDRAASQLAAARAAVSDTAARRALLEHALAALAGEPAPSFVLAPAEPPAVIPVVPAAVPSRLLERRPDIAAAERRVFAANRRVGVARAAFYPTITLQPQGGFQNTGEVNLLTVPNTFWTIGPQFALDIFDGGYRHAAAARARAALARAGDDYRATVLRAFREVQDQLALEDRYAAEAADQAQAVKAAQATRRLALIRYRDGAANYLEVVVAQTAELEAERGALALQTQRQRAAVDLVLALGGDWIPGALPTPRQALRLNAPS